MFPWKRIKNPQINHCIYHQWFPTDSTKTIHRERLYVSKNATGTAGHPRAKAQTWTPASGIDGYIHAAELGNRLTPTPPHTHLHTLPLSHFPPHTHPPHTPIPTYTHPPPIYTPCLSHSQPPIPTPSHMLCALTPLTYTTPLSYFLHPHRTNTSPLYPYIRLLHCTHTLRTPPPPTTSLHPPCLLIPHIPHTPHTPMHTHTHTQECVTLEAVL